MIFWKIDGCCLNHTNAVKCLLFHTIYQPAINYYEMKLLIRVINLIYELD